LEFDEKKFSWEPLTSSLIFKILGFSFFMMIGFDTFEVEVRRLPSILSMLGFFSKTSMWLKARAGSNRWEWVLMPSSEYHFYFTSPGPFNST
jgi:hypothetical protein